MNRRVLVGQFLLEANTFAPGTTTLDDFRAAGLWIGDDLRRSRLPQEDELAAAWDVLEEAGYTCEPAIRAWAGARPPMTDSAFEAIVDAVVERIDAGLAGVFLSLHGAAVASGVDDPEGTLLEAVRRRLGDDSPIAISLDCHAGITERMVANADIITGYRTVPHIDMRRTGAQAARLLVAAIEGRIDPVPVVAHRPLIGPAIRQNNELEPFGELMRMCDTAEERSGVLSAAFFPSHPWRDVPDLSWSVVVTTDDDRALGAAEADRIADRLWDVRSEFFASDAMPMVATLEAALGGPLPAVIADAGDSPTGGSEGDSTELLRAALRHPSRSIWMTVTDPTAASRAVAAGLGREVTIQLGTGAPGSYNEATTITGIVTHLPDGPVVYEASLAAGKTGDLGASAVLAVGQIRVLVHSRQVLLIDAAAYKAAGLDPADAEVMQAKSHVTFRAGFEHLVEAMYVADTPGPTPANLLLLDYQRRPRPLYPFEGSLT